MQWAHGPERCPNLVADVDSSMTTADAGQPVKILWGRNFWRHWKSLAHVWSEWYREYLDADFPRLIIRFEGKRDSYGCVLCVTT